MSQKTILALVEALRLAGRHTTEPNMPLGPTGKDWCPECGHIDNSKEVDAAARALVAEIETTVGHEWTCSCGHVNGSNLAICSQCARYPGETT